MIHNLWIGWIGFSSISTVFFYFGLFLAAFQDRTDNRRRRRNNW